MIRILACGALAWMVSGCGATGQSSDSSDAPVAVDTGTVDTGSTSGDTSTPDTVSATDTVSSDGIGDAADTPSDVADTAKVEDTAPNDTSVTSDGDAAALDLGPETTSPPDVSGTDTALPQDTGPAEVTTTQAEIRLMAPLSTSMSTSKRPFFRVELQGEADGTSIEICEDHACTSVLFTIDLEGAEGISPNALSAGVVYWRATATLAGQPVSAPSVVWQLRIGHGSSDIATSWGAFFDYNLDGYADALVGGCGLQGCTQNVFVHAGGPEGLSIHPVVTLENVNTPYFGMTTAPAGDVNGDGYPDLLVGTAFGDSAMIFLNGPNGISSTPSQTWFVAGAWNGFAVAAAGDVNGDGYGDIVVGAMLANIAFVYYGGPEGPGPAPDVPLTCPGIGGCGVSVAGAGDVNGDRYSDVIVGSGTANEAYVYHGGEGGISVEPVITLSGVGLFGTSVDMAGDVNGDGYTDVVIGAPESSKAHLFLGGPDGIAKINEVPISGGAQQGIAVSRAGDVNADGLMDIVIGSKYIARLYLGHPATGIELTPIELVGDSVAFADALAGVGDTDGNGYDDVLVGATDQDKAFLYLGDANGFPTFPSKALFVEGGAPGYGYVVAKSWHLDLKQALSHHVRGTIAALRRRLTPRTGYQHALWGEVHASGVGSAGQRGRDPWEFRGLCFQMVTGRTGGAARARCEGGSETLA